MNSWMAIGHTRPYTPSKKRRTFSRLLPISHPLAAQTSALCAGVASCRAVKRETISARNELEMSFMRDQHVEHSRRLPRLRGPEGRAARKDAKQPAPWSKQPPAPTAQPGGGTAGWKAMAPKAGEPDLKAQLAGLNAAREALLVSGAPTTAFGAIEQEAAEIRRQLKDLRPTGEKLECLRGVIRRGERRLQEAAEELVRIQAQTKGEQEEITLHRDELAALETELVQELQGLLLGPPEVPPWLKDTLLQLATHLRSGGPIDPQQIAASIEGLTIPPPAPEPAEDPGEEEDETPVAQAST